MRPLIKAVALVLFTVALTLPARVAVAQCQGDTLQAQQQSATEAQQFEMLSPDNMQSLFECAEWAAAISATYALARILLRRPRVPMVLFPVEFTVAKS